MKIIKMLPITKKDNIWTVPVLCKSRKGTKKHIFPCLSLELAQKLWWKHWSSI